MRYDMEPIIDSGAPAYNATLPHQQIVAGLQDHEIPANLSFYAGTHCCNHMLYSLGYIAQNHAQLKQWGFLHVPQIPNNIVKLGQSGPSMSLAMMVKAVRLSIDCIVTQL
ncbi:MAG: pyroglutamyl-peptidase I, partial [Pseudomonadota bacterium]